MSDKIKHNIDYLYDIYKTEYDETPFYHHTVNCQLKGKIDELNILKQTHFTDEEVGCYLTGRIKVLEELKELIIFGDKDGRTD